MRYSMNNQIPFFNPYINLPNINQLEEKIERLEKNINILENRIKKLENTIKSNNKNDFYNDDINDMYMI